MPAAKSELGASVTTKVSTINTSVKLLSLRKIYNFQIVENY